ncbi:hypothetical protein H6S82_08050 [Planktothrix sp. FACHB-1355]|uniref:Uncharacterized protein n=1 Tax=Aerosakkonema funiforme FACHB-1375 TaxID=2949571 RepID=A0A926ZFF3_9CYAN|nr:MULTISPECIES: hypothetical protein [Oscillatoriales]MBD2181058.1 hypothetical protein [Aerosakkonema funiforme FACHB-1375]MBD3558807.1 hypothetical protein [Planktothrix sp. FACHB-1355]
MNTTFAKTSHAPIQQLNKAERKLFSFGIQVRPHQHLGKVTFPVRYCGAGFGVILSFIGNQPTEQMWGDFSSTAYRAIKAHFDAFCAVDSL